MENFKNINVMAHFAEIDENNIVLRVVVVLDENEPNGEHFLSEELGLGGRWIKTSYNSLHGQHRGGGVPFRKNFAAVGYKYDEARDAFIPPAPFPSWTTIDEDKCIHVPPVPMPICLPTDPFFYIWDEEQLSWVKQDTER
jgi:hypothetical protein